MHKREEQYGNFVPLRTMQNASAKVSLFWIQLWITYWWQSTSLTALLQNLPSCSTHQKKKKTVISVIESKTRCLQVLFIVCNSKPSTPEMSVTINIILFFFLLLFCFVYIDSFFFIFSSLILCIFTTFFFHFCFYSSKISFSFRFLFIFVFLSCTPRLLQLKSQPDVV